MVIEFYDFSLDEGAYELRRSGAPIQLEPKVFEVLAYLVRNRERVVTKDELLEQLWPGEFVTSLSPAHLSPYSTSPHPSRARRSRLIPPSPAQSA